MDTDDVFLLEGTKVEIRLPFLKRMRARFNGFRVPGEFATIVQEVPSNDSFVVREIDGDLYEVASEYLFSIGGKPVWKLKNRKQRK